MRNSHRITAAFVCAIALLALPAHAAPASGETTPTSIEQIGSWLGSLWDGLLEIVLGPAPEPTPPSGNGSTSPILADGGSCIDPDGCRH